METLLTKEILDCMQKIGDPVVDPHVTSLLKGNDEDKRGLLELINEARKDGLAFLKDEWLTTHARDYGVNDFLVRPGTLPDPDLVETACNLFKRYGSEIAAALLLAALPEAYAAGEGAKVLFGRSQLAAGGAVSTRRILATAQFVIWVLTPGTPSAPVSDDMSKFTYQSFDDTRRLWDPKDQAQALRASLALRIMHALIRKSRPITPEDLQLDDAGGDVPLNQTDLLATLLSFSITVFEVLEQFGITWTAEEQEAYFYVWDRVGETLGIGDMSVIQALTGLRDLEDLKKALRGFDEGNPNPFDGLALVDMPTPGSQVTSKDRDSLFKGRLNRLALRRVADASALRPQSVPEARAMLARLRERMWALEKDSFPQRDEFDYENFKQVLDDVSPGRILLKAMVDELAARMPASQKTWPIAVIRQLVPPRVQNRLALGGTSSVGFFGGIVGMPGDSPGSAVLRRVTAEVLRQRATRVSNSLFLHYYDHGQLTIPGLRSTAVGYGLHWKDQSVSARPDGLF